MPALHSRSPDHGPDHRDPTGCGACGWPWPCPSAEPEYERLKGALLDAQAGVGLSPTAVAERDAASAALDAFARAALTTPAAHAAPPIYGHELREALEAEVRQVRIQLVDQTEHYGYDAVTEIVRIVLAALTAPAATRGCAANE